MFTWEIDVMHLLVYKVINIENNYIVNYNVKHDIIYRVERIFI